MYLVVQEMLVILAVSNSLLHIEELVKGSGYNNLHGKMGQSCNQDNVLRTITFFNLPSLATIVPNKCF
jgi:hypothetical protein